MADPPLSSGWWQIRSEKASAERALRLARQEGWVSEDPALKAKKHLVDRYMTSEERELLEHCTFGSSLARALGARSRARENTPRTRESLNEVSKR